MPLRTAVPFSDKKKMKLLIFFKLIYFFSYWVAGDVLQRYSLSSLNKTIINIESNQSNLYLLIFNWCLCTFIYISYFQFYRKWNRALYYYLFFLLHCKISFHWRNRMCYLKKKSNFIFNFMVLHNFYLLALFTFAKTSKNLYFFFKVIATI